MVSQEVRETIYIAISCMIAAAVITLAAFVLQLRTQAAENFNAEQTSERVTESYLKFEGYQDKIIYGSELAALIREFWGTDTIVYVNEMVFKLESNPKGYTYKGIKNWDTPRKTNGTYLANGNGIYLDSKNVLGIETKFKSYLRDGVLDKENTFFNTRCTYDYIELTTGRDSTNESVCKLIHGLDVSEAYYVYLVLDTKVPEEFIAAKYQKTILDYSNVTGIMVKHVDKSVYNPEDIVAIDNVGEMIIKDAIRKRIEDYR